MSDLISREALKKDIEENFIILEGVRAIEVDCAKVLIDNAPTVKSYTLEDLEKAKNNGYKWGRIDGQATVRPQGEFTLNDLKGYLLFYGYSSDAVEDMLINFESYVKGKRDGVECG